MKESNVKRGSNVSEKKVGRPPKAAVPMNAIEDDPTQEVVVGKPLLPVDENQLKQVLVVSDSMSDAEILRSAALPGTRIEFDSVHFKKLDEAVVGLLPEDAQKSYASAGAAFESKRKLANRALFETPTTVDPMSKLLDGPRGMANPLTRDAEYMKQKLPGYYVTWRVEGGQGDIENAKRAGFREMRHPKDDNEEENVNPLEWTGPRWSIRDGTVDPASGDQIYNVMVVIRQKAWDENLQAMSLVSHNAYMTHKKQFVENADNITRDTKESIEISDLDDLHAEEHSVFKEGKRVRA